MTTVRTRVLTALAALAVLAAPVVSAPTASAATTASQSSTSTPIRVIVRTQPRVFQPITPQQAPTARMLTALDASLVVASDRLNDAAAKGTVNAEAADTLRENITADRAIVATLASRLRGSTTFARILAVQRAARSIKPDNYTVALRDLARIHPLETAVASTETKVNALQARLTAAPAGTATAAAAAAVTTARGRVVAARAAVTRVTSVVTTTRATSTSTTAKVSLLLGRARVSVKMAATETAKAAALLNAALGTPTE